MLCHHSPENILRRALRSSIIQILLLYFLYKTTIFSDKIGLSMTTAKAIRTDLRKLPKGTLFTNSRFLKYGTRSTVSRTLSRLVAEGEVKRLARGVFVRPKKNRFVGDVMPEISEIVKIIARDNHETIQVHGAEAARRFKLSIQVPVVPVYYTNASSRLIKIGNITVKMVHTSSQRRLQFAGEKTGLALSALWYVGKDNVNAEAVSKIKSGLSAEEFETLRSADMPAWLEAALNEFAQDSVHG